MDQPNPDQVAWLDTPQQLDDWLADLPPEHPVGMDSEFERVTTFHAIPGLMQLAAAGEVALVEPGAAEGSGVLRKLLEDADRSKHLYAMSEDIELFRDWLGVRVRGALDLQLAAAFAGHGMSVGYARLVESCLGVALGKGETRSDWLARPLSDAQLYYAVADVHYLRPLHEQLMEQVAARGFQEALAEESRTWCERQSVADAPESYYLRLTGAWRLRPGNQAVLRALCTWREHRCRELDRPRGRVIEDRLLIRLAEAVPRSRKALAAIEDMPSGVVRREGDALLAVISEVVEGPEQSLEPIPAPLTRSEKNHYRNVKRILAEQAESLDLPLELIASRRYLEPAVRTGLREGRLPDLLTQGWRGRALAPRREELEACFHE
ncbi:HRDC domain-containing protein [uncultured Halovibrio sp.]|uniref:ribonuclease D n=1 Tax=uncultured Halovibrio sp. TaxID=985049 RepID=UPI0025DDC727|nr:HRDC domain-containing protein [uncultured Halovibrio sp.]